MTTVGSLSYRGSAVSDTRTLGRLLERLLAESRLHAPSATGLDLQSVRLVDEYDFRTDRVDTVCVIEALVSDPTQLVGRPNCFTGPRLLAIETALRSVVQEMFGASRVRVAPTITGGLSPTYWQPGPKKLVNLVPIAEAIRNGVIRPDGLVYECCEQYGIEHVVVCNGKLLGPSPDLADRIRALLEWDNSIARILDPFAGSRLTERVCQRVRTACQVVSKDALSLTGEHTGHDSFSSREDEKFDVLVMDPFYEDVIAYADKVARESGASYFIVESGDASDIHWCHAADTVMREFAMEITILRNPRESGKHIRVYANMRE